MPRDRDRIGSLCLLVGLGLALALAAQVGGQCQVFSDPDSFEGFLEEELGWQRLGVEDFEPPVSNLGPADYAFLLDPLEGGIANTDPGSGLGFPGGLATGLVTILSNAGEPEAPAGEPGSGLAAIGPGFLDPGLPSPGSVMIGAEMFSESTDLVFQEAGYLQAVGFTVEVAFGGTAVVTVFDQYYGEPIAVENIEAPQGQPVFVGVWCVEYAIGRVNIAGAGGELVDDIELWGEGPPPTCPWDCGNGDGLVNVVDFLALLAQWGTPGSCDFDGKGVSVTDFLALLAHWGPCPGE